MVNEHAMFMHGMAFLICREKVNALADQNYVWYANRRILTIMPVPSLILRPTRDELVKVGVVSVGRRGKGGRRLREGDG